MKTEDILKTIAIVNGYDRNIKFDKWRIQNIPGEWCYEFSAENGFGDIIHICEQYIGNAINKLIKEIFNNHQHIINNYVDVSASKFLDDKWRTERINNRNNVFDEISKFIKKTKPVNDWWKLNNPCIGCTLNKKDIYDPIHYHCKLNHTHQCEILNEALKEYDERMNISSDFMHKHLMATYNAALKSLTYHE